MKDVPLTKFTNANQGIRVIKKDGSKSAELRLGFLLTA